MSFLKPVVPILRGIIIRDEHDRVIMQATAQDVRRFAAKPGQHVQMQPSELRVRLDGAKPSRGEAFGKAPEHVGTIHRDEFLYDRAGLPVARITQVAVHSSFTDVSSYHGPQRALMGLDGKVDIQAEGLPGVAVQ